MKEVEAKKRRIKRKEGERVRRKEGEELEAKKE